MTRLSCAVIAVVALVAFGSTNWVQAQMPYSPMTSPYLNLLRTGQSPGLNWMNIVQPQMELFDAANQLQMGQFNLGQSIAGLSGGGPPAMSVTGHPAMFGNYLWYYPFRGGMGMTRGGMGGGMGGMGMGGMGGMGMGGMGGMGMGGMGGMGMGGMGGMGMGGMGGMGMGGMGGMGMGGMGGMGMGGMGMGGMGMGGMGMGGMGMGGMGGMGMGGMGMGGMGMGGMGMPR